MGSDVFPEIVFGDMELFVVAECIGGFVLVECDFLGRRDGGVPFSIVPYHDCLIIAFCEGKGGCSKGGGGTLLVDVLHLSSIAEDAVCNSLEMRYLCFGYL